MRILYTGALKAGSLTSARLAALRSLGHDVDVVDQVPFISRGSRLVEKVQNHLSVGPGISAYNRSLADNAAAGSFDLIYVDQACFLAPSTVREIRQTGSPVVEYTSDYFGFRRHSFRRLLASIALYDAHVITNPFNMPELERRGAKTVLMSGFGFDPALHRRIDVTPDDRERFGSDVCFVGHWEPSSEARIAALRNSGVRVRVWGPGWQRSRLDDREDIRPVYEEEYVKVLSASKICLCLLSKWNRNTSASRTFEIPAVGSLLLAERTPEHLATYVEGSEAEFFGDDRELVQKATAYLADDTRREMVAEAGHRRCLTSGYSQRDRVASILEGLASEGVTRAQAFPVRPSHG